MFHESYGEVTPSLMRAIKKYNVSPSDYSDLEDVYGNDLVAIEKAIKHYVFQGQFSVFEFWNRRPL